jgi:hypothetical protein
MERILNIVLHEWLPFFILLSMHFLNNLPSLLPLNSLILPLLLPLRLPLLLNFLRTLPRLFLFLLLVLVLRKHLIIELHPSLVAFSHFHFRLLLLFGFGVSSLESEQLVQSVFLA